MDINEIIESNIHLLGTDKSLFIDKCFNDYYKTFNNMINLDPLDLRNTFDFGLEVSDAILDYKINYEQYNEKQD